MADYLAHALWSYVFFHKTEKPWKAILFGILPDTISFGWVMIYLLFTGFEFGPPSAELFPRALPITYGLGHSLVVALAVIAIVYLIKKKWYIYMFAWPIAILIDTPLHTRELFPTPFLWPLSSWTFPGVSWASSWFMLLNYSLLLLAFAYIIRKKFIARRAAR